MIVACRPSMPSWTWILPMSSWPEKNISTPPSTSSQDAPDEGALPPPGAERAPVAAALPDDQKHPFVAVGQLHVHPGEGEDGGLRAPRGLLQVR